jgi:exodeoxyribonuclease V alpha subunit
MTSIHPNPRVAALIEEARRKHALLAAEKAEKAAKQAEQQASGQRPPASPLALQLSEQSAEQAAASQDEQITEKAAPAAKRHHLLDMMQSSSALTFNDKQREALEAGLKGESFCLIGAAGTGKTTVTQELISLLQQSSHVLPIAEPTKHLVKDNPGIVIVGFTNKAVNNIKKKLPAHLQAHCITIHKLLEYQPVYYEVPGEDGNIRTTMRFEPARNGANPLPHISTLIIEESSMVGTDLYGEVINALANPARTQIIFLGDLNQIPPVFGPSILGFKLAELKTVELTHVYRQALLSPIISLATAVRLNSQPSTASSAATSKNAAPAGEEKSWHETASMTVPSLLTEKIVIDREDHGKLTIHPWKKRVSNTSAITFMKSFLPTMIEAGTYDPEADMILCPFNKSFGTVELNKIIADHLGKKRGELVYEVIARYVKSYWAVGDRVMVDRHEAIITKIQRTVGYAGKLPRTESKTLDRWGFDPESDTPSHEMTADEILNQLDNLAADDEGKNLASHEIHVYIPDTDERKILNTAGDINQMLFGYAITIHKSQGSEWQKVFLFLHNSHATMLSRELIYTGVTRAKHELYIICEGDIKPYENSLKRAAERPIIPGTSLAEKISYFRGKALTMKSLAESE